MKIILHGASNGSNFGDFLFADLFYKELTEVNSEGKNLFFECPKYGIGPFFRKELGYYGKQTLKDLLDADLLVYFSGGYFGESSRAFWRNLKLIFRYDLIGLLFLIRRKPIVIIGIGGGPVSLGLRRKLLCKFMESSLVTTVRDTKTKEYFQEYGVSSPIIVTSDTAQIITKRMVPVLDERVNKIISKKFAGKRILLLHLPFSGKHCINGIEKIMKAVNAFLEKHDKYGVIISRDSLSSKRLEEGIVYNWLKCSNVFCYSYEKPWQFCSLLNQVDFVITTKLHVGIVAAALSKSVLSFPFHSDKVVRYYEQIGEHKRCIPLIEATEEVIYQLMEQYHDKNINLSNDIRLLAQKNLDILRHVVKELKNKSGHDNEK